MKQYFTGFFTAVCLTASVFLFMGSQNKNLGDIEANSISIVSPEGTTKILGGMIETFNKDEQLMTSNYSSENGGLFKIYNSNGYMTGMLATTTINSGILMINGDKNNEVASLATIKQPGGAGGGVLEIFNQHNISTVKIGIAMNDAYKGDGFINLFDRYGDLGWSMFGKQ